MKFNHLVEINDPANPLIEPLTREQVWRGLLQRAEDPVPFVVGLDECRIVERSRDGLTRELVFGSLIVRDRVSYDTLRSVRYDTAAQEGMPAGQLVMSIEEPQPGALFVRFEYDSGPALEPDDAMSEMYDDFRRNAYEESDIDTVRRIRELAATGQLGGTAN
jgi:hypothetical protein